MDPAANLGPSIFLHVLSHLPYDTILAVERVARPWRDLVRSYENSVWRHAAVNLAADHPDLDIFSALPADAAREVSGPRRVQPPLTLSNAEGVERRSEQPWRKACENAVELERNWRYGRVREHWIRTPGDAAWRFKIDAKQGTCLSTSRQGGLHVVDTETSERIFTIDGVRPYSHLEFVAGHAVFDGDEEDLFLLVYRTSDAVAASKHPSPPTFTLPDTAPPIHSSKSFTQDNWIPQSGQPLPRGHLEFYKAITPPTPCHAFRARIDSPGTSDERSLVAAAGEDAVYIWDLEEEDPTKVEVIRLDEENQKHSADIEFDEQYVFLCRAETVLILSRRTKRHVYTFPDFQNVFRVHTRFKVPTAETVDAGKPPWRQCVELEGKLKYNDEPDMRSHIYAGFHNDWEGVREMAENFPTYPGLPPLPYLWNCCHYTRDDLHAFSAEGVLMTIRDYRTHLAEEDEDERRRAIANHTICTSVGHAAHLMATTESRLVAAACQEILFWNPGDFPSVHRDEPLPVGGRPRKARCQMAQIVARPGVGGPAESSCLQVDSRRIYVTYRAIGDENHRQDTVPSEYPFMGWQGVAIKCWDFSN